MLIFSSMTMLVIEHDGAIQIKSVEENEQKVEVLLVTVQNNKMGEKLPFTVTNDLEVGSFPLLYKITRGGSCSSYCYK